MVGGPPPRAEGVNDGPATGRQPLLGHRRPTQRAAPLTAGAAIGLFVPIVGVPLAILSAVVLIAWYVLIGWRLLANATAEEPDATDP